MVSNPVKRVRTEEPDEGKLHVRICGEGAGQPVPLPGRQTVKAGAFTAAYAGRWASDLDTITHDKGFPITT